MGTFLTSRRWWLRPVAHCPAGALRKPPFVSAARRERRFPGSTPPPWAIAQKSVSFMVRLAPRP